MPPRHSRRTMCPSVPTSTRKRRPWSLGVQRLVIVVLVVLYAVLLRRAYALYIAPMYGYMGFADREITFGVVLASYVVAALPSLLVPSSRRPSIVAYWILYLFVVVPAAIIPPMTASDDPAQTVLQVGVPVAACFSLMALIYRLPLLKVRRPARVGRLPFLGFGVLAVGMYALVVGSYGLQFNLPSLLEVYDVRLEYRASISSQGRAVGYAVAWIGAVINPLLMAWGFKTKRYLWAAGGALGELLLFGITGHKSILLLVAFVPALILLGHRSDPRRAGLWIVAAGLGIVLAGTVEHIMFQSDYLNVLVVRRQMAGPGLLTGLYFDFFSTHPKANLAHSILRGVVQDRYATAPALIIGRLHFGEQTAANAHIWADAYANFGYVGMVGYTLVLGGVFWTFDSIAKGVDRRLTIPLIGTTAIKLANTALLTALLTHGILLALLVVFFLPRAQGPPAETQNSR